mmetsp:Transcript_5355/g.33558  ORF Transcript_5355/g.33558 Transcript_5355/m.33558 type:complete len:346 (+) Transcript_5355:651-1688(+)
MNTKPRWKLTVVSVGLGLALLWVLQQGKAMWHATAWTSRNACWKDNIDVPAYETKNSMERELGTARPIEHYHIRSAVLEKDQAKLWNRARQLLGLQDASNVQSFGDEKQKFVANQFYTQCTLMSRSLLDGNALYIRIPKNGNDNIRCNLMNWPGEGSDLPCLNRTKGLQLSTSGVRIWTFVRHPISRFVSGYTEVEFRNQDDPKVQAKFTHPIGTKERFREYVTSMLQGRKVPQIYHTFSQSWLGTRFPVITAGKIESMDKDWLAIQEWLGIARPIPFDKECNVHPTSADPLGTTAIAKLALEEDPSLMQALCALLLPDFLNFAYELPEVCKLNKNVTGLWPVRP